MLWIVTSPAHAQDGRLYTPDESLYDADPYVLLDAAKQVMSEGKLRRAGRLMSVIPLGLAEPRVDQEILFQRLLLSGANLDTLGYLRAGLIDLDKASTEYGLWLEGEQKDRAVEFADLARQYFAICDTHGSLPFARFGLPYIDADRLADAVLYLSPEMLDAAQDAWSHGKEGLGRGLILTQAGSVLVLSAGANCDLGDLNLEEMQLRLRGGTLIDPRHTWEWVSETALRAADLSPELKDLAAEANELLQVIQQPAI